MIETGSQQTPDQESRADEPRIEPPRVPSPSGAAGAPLPEPATSVLDSIITVDRVGGASDPMFVPPVPYRSPRPRGAGGPDDAEIKRRRALYAAAECTCDDSALVCFAFPFTQDARRRPEYKIQLRLGLVTHDEMQSALNAIEGGVTPQVAMLKHAGVGPAATTGYLADARDVAHGLDPRIYQFADAVHTAQAVARAEAEAVVLVNQPVSWLTRGPAGRATKDVPGWSEDKTISQVAVDVQIVDPELRKQRIAILLQKIEGSGESPST